MAKPHIVQCLCGPARHCISAIAYEPGVSTGADGLLLTIWNATDYVNAQIEAGIALKAINPWCDICGSKRERWVFEDAALAFNSLEEAAPYLRKLEAEQMRIRKHLESTN